jgi:hypothetical protein
MNGNQALLRHDAVSSVVVYDSYVKCIAVLEAETLAPLVIDANAPLTGTIAVQLLQPIGRRQSQVLDSDGRVQREQTHECSSCRLGPVALAD